MAARSRVQLSNNTASAASEGQLPSGQRAFGDHECRAQVIETRPARSLRCQRQGLSA